MMFEEETFFDSSPSPTSESTPPTGPRASSALQEGDRVPFISYLNDDGETESHAFRPYVKPTTNSEYYNADAWSFSVLRKMTVECADTYKKCSSSFRYATAQNPRRVLIQPSVPAGNGGHDNVDSNLILRVNDVLESRNSRYTVLDSLGAGTFGHVVRCIDERTNKTVAVKVIKNKPAYFNQALVEIRITKQLNELDPHDEKQILRIFDHFTFRNHLCLVFELLSINLYELLKQNQFRGLPLSVVRHILQQLLEAVMVLQEAKVIHCDLKPENILLSPSKNSPTASMTGEGRGLSFDSDVSSPPHESGSGKQKKSSKKNKEINLSRQAVNIKLIDFGSACYEQNTVYSYIQSRFYRSPEVLLGLPYDQAIDMWSVGCIGAELFLGLPLFPGISEHNQVSRIVEMLGLPPIKMLSNGRNTSKFFVSEEGSMGAMYRLKTPEEYAKEHGIEVQVSKRYFKSNELDDIVQYYPNRRSNNSKDQDREKERRRAFAHFLKGVLEYDPSKRWSARQALYHPFIADTPFSGTYKPPQDRKRQKSRPPMQALEEQQASRQSTGSAASCSPVSPMMIGLVERASAGQMPLPSFSLSGPQSYGRSDSGHLPPGYAPHSPSHSSPYSPARPSQWIAGHSAGSSHHRGGYSRGSFDHSSPQTHSHLAATAASSGPQQMYVGSPYMYISGTSPYQGHGHLHPPPQQLSHPPRPVPPPPRHNSGHYSAYGSYSQQPPKQMRSRTTSDDLAVKQHYQYPSPPSSNSTPVSIPRRRKGGTGGSSYSGEYESGRDPQRYAYSHGGYQAKAAPNGSSSLPGLGFAAEYQPYAVDGQRQAFAKASHYNNVADFRMQGGQVDMRSGQRTRPRPYAGPAYSARPPPPPPASTHSHHSEFHERRPSMDGSNSNTYQDAEWDPFFMEGVSDGQPSSGMLHHALSVENMHQHQSQMPLRASQSYPAMGGGRTPPQQLMPPQLHHIWNAHNPATYSYAGQVADNEYLQGRRAMGLPAPVMGHGQILGQHRRLSPSSSSAMPAQRRSFRLGQNSTHRDFLPEGT